MIVAPDWVCRLRYYCDQWLVWVAIGALALLAYKKDQQLDGMLHKLEGILILEQHEHEMFDRRLKQQMDFMMKKHKE